MNKILLGIASLLLFAGSAAAQPVLTTPSAGPSHYDMGIMTSFNGVGEIPRISLLKAFNGNYLDLGIGVGFDSVSPKAGKSTSNVTLDLNCGYRMYREMEGHIRPYLEPFGFLIINSGDGVDSQVLGGGAMLGVDFLLFDQFTLGAAVGGRLAIFLTDGAHEIKLGLFTGMLNATFWWG